MSCRVGGGGALRKTRPVASALAFIMHGIGWIRIR